MNSVPVLYPLTAAQRDMVWFRRLYGDSPLFNIGGWHDVEGQLDTACFIKAFELLVRKHDILRMRLFNDAHGLPSHQYFAIDSPVELTVEEAGELTDFDIQTLLEKDFSQPFRLDGDRLYQSRLLRRGPGRHTFSFHCDHLIGDGWTMALLTRSLAAIYEALLRGDTPDLSAPSFSEWTSKEQDYLGSDAAIRARAYWRDRLDALPAALFHGTDRMNPHAMSSLEAESVVTHLPATLSKALRHWAHQHEASLLHVVTAALFVEFAQTRHRSEALAGIRLHNRPGARPKLTAGMFASVCPLRLKLDPEETFAALVTRVARELGTGYRHHRLPLSEMQRTLEAGTTRPQWFDFTVSHEPHDHETRFGAALFSSIEVFPNRFSTLPLQVHLREFVDDQGIEFQCFANRECFSKGEMSLVLDRLMHNLQCIVASPSLRVSSMPLAAPSEAALLQAFSQPSQPNDVHVDNTVDSLHGLFEQTALRSGALVAIEHVAHRVSYTELDVRSNRLAAWLITRGAGCERRIGVCIERGIDMLVAMLAVLKSGAAYVPLDRADPAERLGMILDDSAPLLILTQQRSLTLFRDAAPAVQAVAVDMPLAPWLDEALEVSRLPEVQPHDLAYVLYTSGSTGLPKGVMVEHRHVASRVRGLCARYRITADDRVLQFATLAFDASVEEIFCALSVGACLVLRTDEWLTDGAKFWGLCASARISVVDLPTRFWHQVSRDPTVALPACVRAVIVGGESIDASAVTAWLARSGDRPALFNTYGPTETTVVATVNDVLDDGPTACAIGRPIADTAVYLLDERREPVVVGAIGELYIGGASVARGYINQPGLTAQRFMPDPFALAAGMTGARMYRSGDLGRWLADGRIEFLGRNDHQVKIRGHRVELGAIETSLLRCAGVREAVVIPGDDAQGHARLIAYVSGVLDAGWAALLRARLAHALPPYMMPAAWVRVAAMPLTSNGKLDRSALPAPDENALACAQAHRPPEGELEVMLAMLWMQLLGVPRVGRHDDFFALGGHSLLAVQMASQLREQLGVDMQLAQLFTAPTLSAFAFAVAIEASAKEAPVPPNLIPQHCEAITPSMLTLIPLSADDIARIVAAVPGGARNIQDIYPLAPLQKGILFHHLLNRDDIFLLSRQFAFDSRERLDRFIDALQHCMARHDAYRTAFLWEDLPQPVQVVLRSATALIEVLELDAADGDIAAQLTARFAPNRFRIDLRRPPLMRIHLAHDETNSRWLMQLVSHQSTGDHFSEDILLGEIQALVRDGFDERALQSQPLPPPVPYRNFVARSAVASNDADHEPFFRTMLAGIDEPTLPYGLTDVQGVDGRIDFAQQRVDARRHTRLRARAKHWGVSVGTLAHVAWAMVLAKVTGREDVVFGTVLLGRTHGGAGVERAIGLFLNTLPLRLTVGSVSTAQSIREAHLRLSGLLRHEQASLALAQRCSDVPATLPLFSSLLNYRHVRPEFMNRVDVLEGVSALRTRDRAAFPLEMSVDDSGHELQLDVQVRGGVSATQVCGLLDAALESLVADGVDELALRDLNVLPARERRQVLHDWNDTRVDHPDGRLIHELFESQAALRPDAIALIHEHRTMSYGELNARANRLARHLRRSGIGPDRRAAICMDRGIDMATALLAVLKAGGAYVPLDPGHPQDRLAHMLVDSAPWVMLMDTTGAQALRTLSSMHAVNTVRVQDDASQWAHLDPSDLSRSETGLQANHLAYVIYTSGSTGQPKGAMNEHRGILNRLMWMQQAYGLDDSDVVLQKTPFSFDVSVWEFFWPLMTGARLHIAKAEGHKNPAYLRDLIIEAGITTLHFVPSMLQMFLDQPGLRPGSLRRVFCSGEALAVSLVHRFHDRFEGVALHNLYGPTEAAVDVTAWTCEPGAVGAIIPIGRPVANTRIYILDAHRQPTPAGVTGEIHIAGVQVGRGYLNLPELTAQLFVIDPFADADASDSGPDADTDARMYKTGDLGRWLSDGSIEYLGRNDFQVKIRGLRIELGEIEARLVRLPGIRDAVVLAREDHPGDKRLVAYLTLADLTLADHPSLDCAALRLALSQHLPAYMVPSAYVALASLPLGPNGKLDREALPAPGGAAFAQQAIEAPGSAVEQKVAAIWSALLGIERIGRHDHFFELGGHSLLAMQFVSRVRKMLGVDLDLRDLFAHPTLEACARRVERATASALPALRRRDPGNAVPLSFAQQRLWFLACLDTAQSRAYHIGGGLRLEGTLDVAALQAALDRLTWRHEALRTSFDVRDGQPTQRIAAPDAGFALRRIDLSLHPRAHGELPRIAQEEADTAFDLERGPLARATLVRLGDEAHALLLTLHHIVADGWSMGLLLDELSALYAASHEGRLDPLPPLAIQYPDYAVWQREWLKGPSFDAQCEFWRRQLAGAPPLLQLPTDRPRPEGQDHAGDRIDFRVEPALTASLKALSRRHGTTLFMTLLASWSVLLSRWSGQRDLVIGTPVANRVRNELEPLIGFFVNTLALRIDLSGELSVADLLAQVRESTLAAQANQDLPFEQVVEMLEPPRSASHSPLFQVIFAWQNMPEGRIDLPGLQFEPLPLQRNAPAKFDLDLDLREHGAEIVGTLVYATSLFDRATIERHLAQWHRLLQAIVVDDTCDVRRLDLLDAPQRRQVLHDWNATFAPYPQDICVHTLFESQAAKTPDAIALECDERSLGYSQLDEAANQLAQRLRRRGVMRGECVALALERSIELVIAELAVLKAGAIYVPLDPMSNGDHQARIVADCGARWLLTENRSSTRVPMAGVGRIDIDSSDAEVEQAFDTEPMQDASVAAYVMYTSGSTGRPNGVVVPHRAISRLVVNNGYADFGPGDRIAFAANPAFDASTLEVWAPLLNGGTMVIIRQEVVLDPHRLTRTLQRHAVNVMWMTSGLFNQYQSELAAVIPQFRYLIIGGDVLDPRVVAKVLEENAPRHLLNGYGPTETTTFALTHEIESVRPGESSIPLGRPIANARVYVLDEHRQPVPVGVTGELYIGGAGLAIGYLNRPELTAERFVHDPFVLDSDRGQPDARMYKTGDLGRWLPDGAIEFLGRNDSQVKIRGFRIELAEVEAQLAQAPGAPDVVVLVRDRADGDKRLLAYYSGPEQSHALRAHARRRLPHYMVPAAYVNVERWPLTANGKLDRRALPEPDETALVAALDHQPPEGELEETLAALWMQLLKVPRVGRHDDFFALGGHSLLAVRLASRVRERLGLELPLAQFFASPTLAGFAQRLVACGVNSSLPTLTPAERGEALPLSFAQQRLWFLACLDTAESQAYHICSGLRLKGKLDVPALQAALDRLTWRHEALRTSFEVRDGQPTQRIAAADTGFALRHLDLSMDRQSHEALLRLGEEESDDAFDLERGPLARAALVRLGEEEHALLLTLHHIVADGWSMGLLLEELSALYAASREGRPDPLPPMRVQYPDYAVWQREWLKGASLQLQRDFWLRHLTGAPALLQLPTDRPRSEAPDHAGEGMAFRVDAALTASLEALSRRHGTTLFMTLLAAWSVLLSRWSGQRDLVIGTPVANRIRSELEPLIGFFVNTLALRIDLSGDASGSLSVADLLARVRGSTLAAQANQDLPFEQVVEVLNPPRSLSHSPLFQVMFAWQNMPEGRLEMPGLQFESLPPARQARAKFDVELELREHGGKIVGTLVYASALFDRTSIERHLSQWQTLLQAIVVDDASDVHRLNLLDAPQRQQVLHDWNATLAPWPTESCVHELFEWQARRTPDAIAVRCEPLSLSYAHLNQQANRLAHHLIGLGVGADQRVAIALERGVDLIVAMLGTLKAGAAYVPIDPAYPRERRDFMLADCAPVALITRGGAMPVAAGLPTLDVNAPPWAHRPSTDVPASSIALTPARLAYVIYTSGSTGRPKGVMVEHAGLCNLVRAQIEAFELNATSRLLQYASSSFDASVSEIFTALCCGATLHLPTEAMLAGWELHQCLSDARISHATLPPSVLASLPEHPPLPSLTTLVVAGEAASPALIERWRHGRLLINAYGPTEATVCATLWRCDDSAKGRSLIGRPIANTSVYLLDEHGAPVVIGATGELHIGGAGVARGYLDQPELTARRFVADPFAQAAGIEGARMYRSGDLGRWLADGRIEFLGRNDHQVKIRGHRVELGEIEAKLLACAGVREAVVTCGEDAQGHARLMAYVCGALDNGWATALRTRLAQSLPSYMMPGAWVRLVAMPLTPNGKLDRSALPAPDEHALSREPMHQPPEGELEALLAALWMQLLGLPRIGRHDDFFALSGHSLLAVQMASRLRESGWQTNVRDIFAAPTIARLARTMVMAPPAVAVETSIPPGCTRITPELLSLMTLTQAEIDAVVAAVEGGAANVQDIYPLAPLQQGLLIDHLSDPANDPYVDSILLRFDDRARLDQYVRALNIVITRHDVLRTSIHWEGMVEPAQAVWRDAPVRPLLVNDVALEPVAALRRWLASPRARVDLRQAPIIKCAMVAEPDGVHWSMVLQMHHIILDHVSIAVMQQEMSALIHHDVQHFEPAPRFREAVALALTYAKSKAHEPFFKRMLSDFEPIEPFGLGISTRGAADNEARMTVDPALGLRLVRAATLLQVSVAALHHVAWALVLARASDRDDVVLGTVLLGRTQLGAGGARMLGLLINALPLRVQLGAHGAAQAVRSVHAALLQLLEHEQAPLMQVQRCSTAAGRRPLFNSLINYRHSQRPDEAAYSALKGISASVLTGDRNSLPLTLSVDAMGAEFELTATALDPVDPRLVCAMMQEALSGLVERLEDDQDAPVGAIDVMPAALPVPAPSCLHTLFERAAAQHCERIAVEHGGRSFSYRELNARTDALARELRRRGVKSQSVVAWCGERGIEMLVAFWSILKAGGVYLPLDVTHPALRLRRMLLDSAPVLLLTQARCSEALLAWSGDVPVIALDAQSESVDPATGLSLAGKSSTETSSTERSSTARSSIDDAPPEIRADHLACIIYTSGSTGSPKGVMIEHRQIVGLLGGQRGHVLVDERSRILQSAAFTFDASVWELATALCNGAKLVIPDTTATLAGEVLVEQVRRHRITHLFMSPAVLAQLDPEATLPSVQVLVVGGQQCSRTLAERWSPGRTMINGYGPTETTVFATMHRIAGPLAHRVPIGRPLESVHVYILDARQRLVPPGTTGELWIGGHGVARGYLNQPELTAQCFMPDPFARRAGDSAARMYRSGDLGRWLPDGSIEFNGRADDQVKIDGSRTELGEVEAAICSLPWVDTAAVAVAAAVGPLPHGRDQRLIGYYTLAAGQRRGCETQMREDLLRILPRFMVPAALHEVKALPLTSHGKVDRKALALNVAGNTPAIHEPPEGASEELLARIWAQVLGIDKVGRHDDFFALGGHSFLAIKVVSALGRHGISLPLESLYAHPSIAALTPQLRSQEPRSHAAVLVRAGGRATPLFLMHEFYGSIAYAYRLARRMPPGLPVYALPPAPSDAAPTRSVQAMAERLAGLIRAAQPRGPYRLAGWSFGGYLAYETARCLQRRGDRVSFVGMFDTHAPESIPRDSSVSDSVRAFERDVRAARAAIRHEPDIGPSNDDPQADAPIPEIPDTPGTPGTPDKSAHRHLDSTAVFAAMDDAEIEGRLRHVRLHAEALDAYRPRSLDLDVHLFAAQDGISARNEPENSRLGWDRLAHSTSLRVARVEGDHHSMLDEAHVESLAASLAEALRLNELEILRESA